MTRGAPDGDLTPRAARRLLVAITALAALLRFHRLGADLWLDEIAPILMYGELSPLEVVGSYTRPNNHILNTLLVNGATALFGRVEWAIRLPAALFGIATVPALYRLGRLGLDRRACLGAALLLAVAQPHVAYSQNARGYAAYLFFALVSSRLWLVGARRSGLGRGCAYAAAVLGGAAAHPLAAFVLAAHWAVALSLWRRSAAVRRRTGWLLAAAAAAAIPPLLLYLPVLSRALREVGRSYLVERIGFSPFSPAMVQEALAAILGGLDPIRLVVLAAVLPVGLAGGWRWLRRQPAVAGCLLLPPLLTALAMSVAGSTAYPRFFLLALPAACLAAIEGAAWLAEAATRIGRRVGGAAAGGEPFARPLATALVLVLAAVSAASLVSYYAAPKQSYRAALEYLTERVDRGAAVVAADLTEGGFRYYAPRAGLVPGRNLFFARNDEALDAVLERMQSAEVLLVTTFQATLHHRWPTLPARLAADWRQAAIFPASVRDGELRIWQSRIRERRESPGS